jgi:hypothetical protein
MVAFVTGLSMSEGEPGRVKGGVGVGVGTFAEVIAPPAAVDALVGVLGRAGFVPAGIAGAVGLKE